LIEQTALDAAAIVNDTTSPVDEPVTVLVDDALGVYLPPATGLEAGVDVNDTICPACAMAMACVAVDEIR
jgi:uncharacterized protein (UPF0212 family)